MQNVKESRALPPPPQSLITPAELTAKRQSLEEVRHSSRPSTVACV